MQVDLLTQIRSAGLPEPVAEHLFHPVRKWRFDHSWLRQKVACEIQGGSFSGGKHTRGVGYRNDCAKLCEAQLLGWLVLWVTTDQVRDGSALSLLVRALASRP